MIGDLNVFIFIQRFVVCLFVADGLQNGFVFFSECTRFGVHVKGGSRIEDLGIERHSLAAAGAFATVDARLKTFETWPLGLPQKPEDLADAGLYYSGVRDEVKCFHCDGGLRGWEAEDDPWIEHAKWYPHCQYLVLLKGRSFIEGVRNEVRISSRKAWISRYSEELMQMEPALSALRLGFKEEDLKKVILNELDKSVSMLEDEEEFRNGIGKVIRRWVEEKVESVRIPSEVKYEPGDADVGFNGLGCVVGRSVQLEEGGLNSGEGSSSSHGDVSIGGNGIVGGGEGSGMKDESEDMLCKICMEKKVSIVILPCGHLCLCTSCTSSLKNECPFCRKPFRGYVRAFIC